MSLDIFVPFFGIFGIVVGGFLQYYFSSASSKRNHLRDLQTKSYIDFINGIAAIAISQRQKQPADEFKAMVMLTDAKARISIYGDLKVAKAVADFFRNHGALDSDEAAISMINILSTMRSSSLGPKDKLGFKDIGQLILSKDYNEQQPF